MAEFNNTINDPISVSSPNIQNVSIVRSDIELTFNLDPTATMHVSGDTFINGSQKTQIVDALGNVVLIQPANTTGHTPTDNVLLVQVIDAQGNVSSGSSGGGAVTIVDGGAITLGFKSDPRSGATDNTEVSQISILKEISYMEQNPANQPAMTDGSQITQIIGTIPISASTFTDGSMVTQVVGTVTISGTSQSVNANGKPNYKPDYWDTTTSSTLVYEGYKSGAIVTLAKIDLTGGTRTWAIDSWANRVTATYS